MSMTEIRDLIGAPTIEVAQRQFRRCRQIYGSVSTGRLRQTKPPLTAAEFTSDRTGRIAPMYAGMAKKAMTRGVIATSMEYGYLPSEMETLIDAFTSNVRQS